MTRGRTRLAALAALALASAAAAAPQTHTCALTRLQQRTFSPVALPGLTGVASSR